MSRQNASCILMVRPANLDYNELTAPNNPFQDQKALEMKASLKIEKSRAEFDHFVASLQEADIEVKVFEDSPEPRKSDAVFPNNWVSFHEDGRVILYPMFAPNRRSERRQDVLDTLSEAFDVKEVIDLSPYEAEGKYLESTGSMVLDRQNQLIYANYSVRTHPELLDEVGKLLDYEVFGFEARDPAGIEIYHCNVLMSVGREQAIICTEVISNPRDRDKLRARLRSSQKELVEISYDQLRNFAGNALEVSDRRGRGGWVMSSRAYRSLLPEQREILEEARPIVHAPLDVIEANGGGSARCMMAEVFLPRKSS